MGNLGRVSGRVLSRFLEELPWRVVQHITSDKDHDCFGALSSNSSWRVVQYFTETR